MRTYFDRLTGVYLGSWNWPVAPEQLDHPDLAGHLWKEGQVGSSLYRLNLLTDTLELVPVVPQPDWDGFRLACLGGVFAANYPMIANLIDTYPSFVVGIQYGNLDLVQAAIGKAHMDYAANPTTGISPAMEAAIQAAMVANHLVLP